MYFWRTRALAEDLRAGRVSERQRMSYLLSQTVLASGSIPVSLAYRTVWSYPISTAVVWLTLAVVHAAGVLLCYEANRWGDDREFVNRFVCLSWPITIRLVTLLILPFFVALFAVDWWTSWRGSDIDLESDLVPRGFGFVVTIAYYFCLWRHLRWVAAAPAL